MAVCEVLASVSFKIKEVSSFQSFFVFFFLRELSWMLESARSPQKHWAGHVYRLRHGIVAHDEHSG